MNISYTLKSFEDLSPFELYNILQLRNEVFAVEQQCVYPDMDDKDQVSYHLLGRNADKLLAYTRLIPPGISYKEPSIGRVVTSPSIRRSGEGRILMEKSIQLVNERFPGHPIRIGAQLYLQKFYASLGFLPCSDIYLEDGIEHIEMLLG